MALNPNEVLIDDALLETTRTLRTERLRGQLLRLARPFKKPAVMAGTNTITVGTRNAASTLNGNTSNNRTFAATDSRISYLGTVTAAMSGDATFRIGSHLAGVVSDNSYRVRFGTDMPSFEIALNKINSSDATFRVMVDGEWISESYSTVSGTLGGVWKCLVAFDGSYTNRIITLELQGSLAFGGIDRATASVGSTIRQVQDYHESPKVLWYGDSITNSTAVAGYGSGFAHTASRLLGLDDYIISGAPGSGFLVQGTNGVTALERIADLTRTGTPDLVVVAFGINDRALVLATWQAAVTAWCNAAALLLPKARFIFLGSWRTGGASPVATWDTTLQTAVTASTLALRSDVIATFGWQTGTGSTSNLLGNGNGDRYMSSDNIHPSAAGAADLGQRTAENIVIKVRGWTG